MSRSYLDLCRALVAELGIAGGTGPSAVTGQSGELANVVRWVADADVAVQLLWQDWQFLWTPGPSSEQLIAGDDTIPIITDLGTEIEDGLVFTVAGRSYRPTWMPWDSFRNHFKTNAKTTLSRPTHWTVRPDKIVELSHIAAAPIPWTMEYHRRPARMTANSQTSPIPDEYDRIIVARAALMYGGREDAPEVVVSMAAEYDDLLEKMESVYLAGFRNHTRSRNNRRPEPDITGSGGGTFGGFG